MYSTELIDDHDHLLGVAFQRLLEADNRSRIALNYNINDYGNFCTVCSRALLVALSALFPPPCPPDASSITVLLLLLWNQIALWLYTFDIYCKAILGISLSTVASRLWVIVFFIFSPISSLLANGWRSRAVVCFLYRMARCDYDCCFCRCCRYILLLGRDENSILKS